MKQKTYEKFKDNKRQFIILVVALVGAVFILSTQAASIFVSVETETTSFSGGISKVNDSTASEGQAIKFGSAALVSDLSNFFPIGTYISPEWEFGKWKALGVNTIVEPPQGTDPMPWADAASSQGLKVISPFETGELSSVLAWNHPDEPDGIYNQKPYSQLQQNYNTYKATNPDMPVFINFIGDLNQYDLQTGEGGPSWYKKYIAAADWISGDTYPVNQGRSLSTVGVMIDKLRSWSGDKPVFAFIESSDYDTTNAFPGPNPGQVRAQIWSAIANGVRGYWFFAPRVTPNFVFDATPSDVATEIKVQNNLVTSLTLVLQQGDINPVGMGASVPTGLEAGWRNHSTGKYFFVVNLTGSTKNNQQISLNGIGSANSANVYQENRSVSISDNTITDNFGPYAVHIYQIQ